MRTTFYVRPQRSDGRGFVKCEPHQATSWAVIRVDSFTSNGRKTSKEQVISHHTKRAAAQGLADANTKRFTPPPRSEVRRLGLRIIKE